VLLLGRFGPVAPLDVFSALGRLHLFRVPRVFFRGMLHGFRRGFRRGIAVLGVRFSRCGRIAGRGQGTAVIAPPRMAAAAAAGPTSATRGCRIRLLR
jgi:hypothetical protein